MSKETIQHQKNERIIQQYADSKMNAIAQKEGKSKEEIFRRMKTDPAYNHHIQTNFKKETAASTNHEVIQASKAILKGQ